MKGLKILLLFLLAYGGAYAQKAQKIPTWYEYDYNQFTKGLAIPSGNWQIPAEYQGRVHLRGSTTDSTLEVYVPSLNRWAKVGGGGGFRSADTSTASGVPFVAPGQWVQQQLAAQPVLQRPLVVNGDTTGIEFLDAAGRVYSQWIFDTGDGEAMAYLRKVLAGDGLSAVNDSTLQADTSVLATKATLEQQIATRLPTTATTDNVSEGSNLYYTDARARIAHGTQASRTFFRGPLQGQANALPTFGLIDTTDLPPIPSKLLTGIYSVSPTGNTAHIRNNAPDTTLAIYDYRGVVRLRVSQNGLLETIHDSNGPVGSVRMQPSADLPSLVFFNASGTGRTQIRMLGSSGGFNLGSVNAATGTVTHLTIDNNSLATFTGKVVMPTLSLTPTATVGTLADGEGRYNNTTKDFIVGKNGQNHTLITADASNNVAILGTVGIGLSTPSVHRLHVYALDNQTGAAGNITGQYNGTFLATQSVAANNYIIHAVSGATDANGTSAITRFIARSDGKVGVGTNNLFKRFTVSGGAEMDTLTVNDLTAGRLVATDANKKLISAGLYGFAQTVYNTSSQTIALTAGAIEQVVFIGGTATSISFPAPVDNTKLWVRNTTASAVSIGSNQPLNDDTTLTSIPARTGYLFVKDGSSWRRLQ